MHKRLPFILAVIIALSITGCKGAKYYYKQGNQFADAGMLEKAVDAYLVSYHKKPKKAKYSIALAKYGTMLLEEVYADFYQSSVNGNDSLAVHHYRNAQNWSKKLEGHVDEERFGSTYEVRYKNHVKQYIGAKVARAKELIAQDQFERAQFLLNHLKGIAPSNHEVGNLLEFATVEPAYRAALALMEQKDYRGVHATLEPIIARYPNQDVLVKLSNMAVERGNYVLGILDFNSSSIGSDALLQGTRSRFIQRIQQINDPFLTIVDRADLDVIASEQQAILEGAMESEDGLSQRILAADAYVRMVITEFDEHEGRWIRTEKRGYAETKRRVKQPDGSHKTIVEHSKVRYTEVQKEHRVNYRINLELIDRATSQIIEIKTLSYHERSTLHYVDYSGKGTLVPGYWKYSSKKHDSDYVSKNVSEKNTLRQLIRNGRTIRSISSMRSDGVDEIGVAFANYIDGLKLVKK